LMNSVCAEGNGAVGCVLPSREPCKPPPLAADGTRSELRRCTGAGNSYDFCDATGFWSGPVLCDTGDVCVPTTDGNGAECNLAPAIGCASDPSHSECRGLTHVYCDPKTIHLAAKQCAPQCLPHADNADGYECF